MAETDDRKEICEGCGKRTGRFIVTLDDCYLCMRCAESAPEATPREAAWYLPADEAEAYRKEWEAKRGAEPSTEGTDQT
ncbi:MAG TPA: hypothetical protein VGP44_12795 [Gemmatimonadales bacterium]|nr:hypothetical protein [Gemmatimonadales bacterium]